MAAATTTASVRCSGGASYLAGSSQRLGQGQSASPSFLRMPGKDRESRRFCAEVALAARGDRAQSRSAVLKAPAPRVVFEDNAAAEEEDRRESIGVEKIDEWLRDSISEIVRGIGEAPFLVHLFSGKSGGVQLRREQASADEWPQIKRRWGKEGQPRPDGIILVEELVEKPAQYDSDEPESSSSPAAAAALSMSEAPSKLWGLVVQGRGMDCVACYVLNTCRVRSPAGFCTHFCLAPARCFGGDPLELQLRNVWLQRLSR